MNESGRCVSALMKRYKADASRMMVIVDDTDLPEGRLRVRGTGGAGTHNGMRSVVEYVGAQDFPRIRIGIGAKPEHWDLADWVLSDCQTDLSKTRMQDACARAADGILIWLEHGVEEAMRRCNRNADEKAAQE
jgi:PTH1 family peptidyl-tRNA hydrolase